MKIDMTIDVYDATRLIREGLEKYFKETMPELQIGNIRVVSWDTDLLRFSQDMLLEPVRHQLNPEYADMVWPKDKPT